MICILCRFVTEIDDQVIASVLVGRCICIRCFARETATPDAPQPALQPAVRRAVAALVAGDEA